MAFLDNDLADIVGKLGSVVSGVVDSVLGVADRFVGTTLKMNRWNEQLVAAQARLAAATTASQEYTAQLEIERLQREKPRSAVGQFLFGDAEKKERKPDTGVVGIAATVAGGVATVGAAFLTLSPVLGVASGVLDQFTSGINTVSKFVGMFNPAAVELLNLAMNDLMATIGRSLQPIVQALIPIVQKFGDAMANIDIGPLVDSVVSMTNRLAEAFFKVLDGMRPVIDVMVNNFSMALEALKPLIAPVTDALLVVANALVPLQQALGGILVAAIDALIEPLSMVVNMVASFADMLAGGLTVVLATITPLVAELGRALTGLVIALKWVWNQIAGMVNFFTGVDLRLDSAGKRTAAKPIIAPKAGTKTRAMSARGVAFAAADQLSQMASVAAGKAGFSQGPSAEEKAAMQRAEQLAELKKIQENTVKERQAAVQQKANAEARSGRGGVTDWSSGNWAEFWKQLR